MVLLGPLLMDYQLISRYLKMPLFIFHERFFLIHQKILLNLHQMLFSKYYQLFYYFSYLLGKSLQQEHLFVLLQKHRFYLRIKKDLHQKPLHIYRDFLHHKILPLKYQVHILQLN